VDFPMDTKYWVYVIQSEVDKRLYVGLSGNIAKRLKSHNNGETFSTKGFRPWNLVYSEEVGDRQEARKREKFLKRGFGKEFIKKLVNNIPR